MGTQRPPPEACSPCPARKPCLFCTNTSLRKPVAPGLVLRPLPGGQDPADPPRIKGLELDGGLSRARSPHHTHARTNLKYTLKLTLLGEVWGPGVFIECWCPSRCALPADPVAVTSARVLRGAGAAHGFPAPHPRWLLLAPPLLHHLLLLTKRK